MAAVSVLVTATPIYTSTDGHAGRPSRVVVTNNSGNTVYLGKSNAVTVAGGLTLLTGSSIGIELYAGESIYGIAGSTSEVRAEGW
jgi:hypothetical protein